MNNRVPLAVLARRKLQNKKPKPTALGIAPPLTSLVSPSTPKPGTLSKRVARDRNKDNRARRKRVPKARKRMSWEELVPKKSGPQNDF